MCGIVGYIGDREAADFLMDGLGKLEYRGYDSAGIAVYHDGAIAIRKKRVGWPTWQKKSRNIPSSERPASVTPAGQRTAVRRTSMPIPIRMKMAISSSFTTGSLKTTWN